MSGENKARSATNPPAAAAAGNAKLSGWGSAPLHTRAAARYRGKKVSRAFRSACRALYGLARAPRPTAHRRGVAWLRGQRLEAGNREHRHSTARLLRGPQTRAFEPDVRN